MGGALSSAGCAVLSFAERIPWVAPVAFLIGAAVRAAHDAKELREDARKFATLVASVEEVLVRAQKEGTLKDSRQAVEVLRSALEEGVAMCNKLAMQGFVKRLILQGTDSRRFAEIQGEIDRGVAMLTLASSVTSAGLALASYEQSESLRQKVDELGGPDSVAKDPALLAQVENELEMSDRLVLGAMKGIGESLSASISRSSADLGARVGSMGEIMRANHDVMSKQVDKLTTMMSALMKLKGGLDADGEAAASATDGSDSNGAATSPPPAPPSAEAVNEAISGAAVRELMDRAPLPAHEARRMAAVRKVGLEGADAQRMVADPQLSVLVNEALAEFDTSSVFIGSVDLDAQTHLVSRHKKTEDANDGYVEFDGWSMSKETTTCQYAIAADKAVVARGSGAMSMHMTSEDGTIDFNGIGADDPAELLALGLAGHKGSQGMGKTMEAAMKGDNESAGAFANLIAAPEKFYASAPVRVDGQVVATFCVLDRQRREEGIDMRKLEELARRAGRRIEERAAQLEASGGDVLAAAAPGDLLFPDEAAFDAVVLDAAADAVVLLSMHSCPYCSEAKGLWRALAARLSSSPALRFACYDITNADAPADATVWGVSQVPAVVLAPRGGRPAVRYGGAAPYSEEGLKAWLESNGVELSPPLDGPDACTAAQLQTGNCEAAAGCAVPPRNNGAAPLVAAAPSRHHWRQGEQLAESLAELQRAHARQLETLRALGAAAAASEAAAGAFLEGVNALAERQSREAGGALAMLAQGSQSQAAGADGGVVGGDGGLLVPAALRAARELGAKQLDLYRALGAGVPGGAGVLAGKPAFLSGLSGAAARYSGACLQHMQLAVLAGDEAQLAAAVADGGGHGAAGGAGDTPPPLALPALALPALL